MSLLYCILRLCKVVNCTLDEYHTSFAISSCGYAAVAPILQCMCFSLCYYGYWWLQNWRVRWSLPYHMLCIITSHQLPSNDTVLKYDNTEQFRSSDKVFVQKVSRNQHYTTHVRRLLLTDFLFQ